ncbi:hypothetical protein L21SP2_0645 [Salinispira pacifica]|uniref:Uncharacterized protein n=1 Tax=Salinispira pacifica TaxID=1307761 RepID=V5WEW3_9SPIO|nr:hypothetical protein L21SP2_0645 [Salinispira pacifica]
MNSEKRNFSAVTLLWLMAQLVTLTGVLVLLLHAPAAAALQDLMGFFPGHAIVPARQILVSVALSLLLVRMALTSLVLLPRRIDPPEAIVVGVWIGIIQFTIGLSALGNGSPRGPALLQGRSCSFWAASLTPGPNIKENASKRSRRMGAGCTPAGCFRYPCISIILVI